MIPRQELMGLPGGIARSNDSGMFTLVPMTR